MVKNKCNNNYYRPSGNLPSRGNKWRWQNERSSWMARKRWKSKELKNKKNVFLNKQITTNPRQNYKDDNERLDQLTNWLQKVESDVSIIETPRDVEKENEMMEMSETTSKRDHVTSSPIKNQESIKSPTSKKNNATKINTTTTLIELHE